MVARLHQGEKAMTVKIRPYRKGGWEVDIMIRLDNGQRYRERRRAPVESKSGALRWGQQRERYLLTHGPDSAAPAKTTSPGLEVETEKKEVPTFAEFAPRFLEGYAKANRHKPSTIEGTEKNLRVHVLPAFGDRRLDELTQEDIQRFKGQRTHLANKTVNHHLSLMRCMFTAAVEWGVIEQMPVELKRLKVTKTTMDFYDFDDFEALVSAASEIDRRVLLMVLLGGEAGLRSGEIRALEWSSIDFRRRMLTVERSEYQGHVTLPKHDKIRQVPMTTRLTEALRAHRHEHGPRVLYKEDGSSLARHTLREWLTPACLDANVRYRSPHCLRHTFCSHLAMRGAPVRAIQELAGHADLKTTQRYMHLTPAALEGAIRLLEQPSPSFAGRGDIMETPCPG
ncbi:MAG TPA: site-specific integrase [Enhygromyxa sp.]|nr:site-specific integrase [Enhygromyxa sp.]